MLMKKSLILIFLLLEEIIKVGPNPEVIAQVISLLLQVSE